MLICLFYLYEEHFRHQNTTLRYHHTLFMKVRTDLLAITSEKTISLQVLYTLSFINHMVNLCCCHVMLNDISPGCCFSAGEIHISFHSYYWWLTDGSRMWCSHCFLTNAFQKEKITSQGTLPVGASCFSQDSTGPVGPASISLAIRPGLY